MKFKPNFLTIRPDGGKDSGVTAYFLIEWKSLFSIGLLSFSKGSREAFHNHAFDAITFWLKGRVKEEHLDGSVKYFSGFSLKPKLTKRNCYHKIIGLTKTWALTFRGPWKDEWNEYKEKEITLTHGRIELK